MKYVFILGHNPKLSTAEVLAVLPTSKIVRETGSFLIIDSSEIDCQKIQNRLGGTVKVGKILAEKIDKNLMVEILKQLKKDNKLNFGLSYYNSNKDKLGMEIKTQLKEAGVSCRLVVSKDKALSSVVVTKNRVVDFLILENRWLGLTEAVQDFEDYGNRDFGRPSRDMYSGSLPPKLAKIMINLAQLPLGARILDPFCGSGTVLQEAILLGYENAIGADVSDKAIKDTKDNLQWLSHNLNVAIDKVKVYHHDVRSISQVVTSVDAVVTEPFLGPPLRGNEKEYAIKKNIEVLSELYLSAFHEFAKIVDREGKIVMVLPEFRLGREELKMPILDKIKKMGFSQLNKDRLVYGRPDQKVWRQIYVFKRQL
ncbi:MAG: RsmD family RNA methyltransferase [Candidatus Buchananbacteria bacterium]|nr:RsmD family RNA methyltransferase [Candidatus Buchananbacteria bacterium]